VERRQSSALNYQRAPCRKARRLDYHAPAGVPLPFLLTGVIVMKAGATAGQV